MRIDPWAGRHYRFRMPDPTPAVPAPIVMVLWSDHEFDEIAEAKAILSKHFAPERIPHIADRILHSEDPLEFLKALDELLTANPRAQAAYLSAHGTRRGLHLHADAVDPMVEYARVAEVLRQHEHDQAGLRLVMGACHAGSSTATIRDLLPKYVTRFTAFSAEPSAGTVSELIASVIGNKIDLFEDVQGAIATGRVARKPGMKPSEVLAQLVTPVLDAHRDDPARFVGGNPDMGFLFDLVRETDGRWREVFMSGEGDPKPSPSSPVIDESVK